MFKQDSHLRSITVNYKHTMDYTWVKHLQAVVLNANSILNGTLKSQ